jgi:hypothetical protein
VTLQFGLLRARVERASIALPRVRGRLPIIDSGVASVATERLAGRLSGTAKTSLARIGVAAPALPNLKLRNRTGTGAEARNQNSAAFVKC